MHRLLKKYFSLLAAQLKSNWVREIAYRSNFLMSLVTDFIWIIVELALFKVLYANVNTLAGWREPQVYFFLGVFFCSDALFTILFQRNFWNFPDLVNRGELDILLTKPVNAVFIACTRWMSITNIFNLALGGIILFHFAKPAGFAGGWSWFSAVLWILFGLAAAFLLRFATSVCVFWTERGSIFSYIYYQLFSLAGKPDTLYPKFIRYALLTAFPFAFIGSVPARALLFGLSSGEMVLVFTVFLAFVWFDTVLWKKGLARYQSASS